MHVLASRNLSQIYCAHNDIYIFFITKFIHAFLALLATHVNNNNNNMQFLYSALSSNELKALYILLPPAQHVICFHNDIIALTNNDILVYDTI